MVSLKNFFFCLKIFFIETGITVAKAYGAYHLPDNMKEIGMGCDILIACPGRLKLISEKRYVVFFF